jgi:HEAT repeat protein
MAGELAKILELLKSGEAELQAAAALVLGELRPKDPAARKALVAALKGGDDAVRIRALEALARIAPQEAVPHAVGLLSASDAVRSRASAVLRSLGPDASRKLKKYMDDDDAAVRGGLVEVIGESKDSDAEGSLFAALLDPDADVARKASVAYRQRIPAMSPAERAAAVRKFADFLGSAKVRKAKTPVAPTLLVLGALGDPASAKAILPYLDRKEPAEVRHHALLALGQLTVQGAVASTISTKLFGVLGDSDFGRVVGPALDVLFKLPIGKGDVDRLLRLLKSAHGRVRQYAVQALGTLEGAKALAGVVGALGGDDPKAAEAAEAALKTRSDAAGPLVQALNAEEDVAKAFRYAGALRAMKDGLAKPVLTSVLARCLAKLRKRQPGFQPYVEVLRGAAPDALREALLARGRELLKKKDFEEAERILRILQPDEFRTPATEFALAVAQLRRQRLDVAAAGRDQGYAVQALARLARREDFGLLDQLTKEAALVSPEGLLYAGFALVERQGGEREVGAAILKLVAKKFGSREEGKVAKQKLKTQGAG